MKEQRGKKRKQEKVIKIYEDKSIQPEAWKRKGTTRQPRTVRHWERKKELFVSFLFKDEKGQKTITKLEERGRPKTNKPSEREEEKETTRIIRPRQNMEPSDPFTIQSAGGKQPEQASLPLLP